MNRIYYLLLIFLLIIITLNSCGDTLGVNGADYIKTQVVERTSTDTMINFKMVRIERTITRTDTIIEYIHIEKKYDPHYFDKKEFSLLESFINKKDIEFSERVPEKWITEFTSYLDYNPLTPSINVKFEIQNQDPTLPDLFNERNDVIYNLKFLLKDVFVMDDRIITLSELKDKISIELQMLNKTGTKQKILNDAIVGEIYFGKRRIIEGQLRGVELKCILHILPKNQNGMNKYSIEITNYITFPSII